MATKCEQYVLDIADLKGKTAGLKSSYDGQVASSQGYLDAYIKDYKGTSCARNVPTPFSLVAESYSTGGGSGIVVGKCSNPPFGVGGCSKSGCEASINSFNKTLVSLRSKYVDWQKNLSDIKAKELAFNTDADCKKEQALSTQQDIIDQEKKRQRTTIIIYIVTIVLLIIISFFIWRRYRKS